MPTPNPDEAAIRNILHRELPELTVGTVRMHNRDADICVAEINRHW
jgi:hypothetical protein